MLAGKRVTSGIAGRGLGTPFRRRKGGESSVQFAPLGEGNRRWETPVAGYLTVLSHVGDVEAGNDSPEVPIPLDVRRGHVSGVNDRKDLARVAGEYHFLYVLEGIG